MVLVVHLMRYHGPFIDLARDDYRSDQQEARLDELKREMSDRVIAPA